MEPVSEVGEQWSVIVLREEIMAEGGTGHVDRHTVPSVWTQESSLPMQM